MPTIRPSALSYSVLALALALAVPAAAQTALPKGTSAGPCVEGICEYTLGNGLQVLLFPDASKPTVTVNVTYRVGSMHENYGETGMAHLLEHLLFKGTPTHADIPAEMKKRGIGFNGTTNFDRTNYYASFPANDNTLRWLLGMEADRMVRSNIAKKDLDSEMTVVRNEMEKNENSPTAVLSQRVRSTAYLWHNYGRDTIGARSDVEGVPIERLQSFYKAWYRPDNATVIVAGRIDPAKTLALISASFAPLPRPAAPLPAFYTQDPTQDGERSVVVRRTGDLQLLFSAYHIPAETHPDNPPLEVLADVLSHVPSGRLHKALVETKLAAGAGSSGDSLRDPGLFTTMVGLPRDADLGKAETVLLAQLENLGGQPITQAELEAAKQRIANGYELGYTNVNAIALGLSGSVAAGDWRLYFVRRDAIAKVSVDDVNRVARAYLKPSNRTLGRFIPTEKPDRAEIGAAPPASALVNGYTGKAAVAAGEQFDATPSNIQARTETFTLGEGLRVSLLPKKTRGGTVVFNARFRFGDEASLTGRSVVAGATGSMIMRGAAGLSREQIDQRFEALKTEAGIGGGLQGAAIGMTSRREQLPEALALAAQILRKPDYPQAEFEQYRTQVVTSLESMRKQPGAVAAQAMGRDFDPWPVGHPLRSRGIEQMIADVKAAKVEDLRAFHRDFYGTSVGEISVVGDFDPVALKAQLQQLFVDWRAPHAFAPIDTHYQPVAPKRERFETPDKANGTVLARVNLSLNDRDADYPALLVADHILGGGGQSRLLDRIRMKDGLSYGAFSELDADASREGRDDAGNLTLSAIAAPENLDKVEAAMREEYARWIRDGVGEQELRDAIAGLITQREQGRASDGAIAGLLSSNLYLDRSMQFQADLDAKLKALTAAEVNAAIRKHFRPDDLSFYIAGDLANAAAKAKAKSSAEAARP
ncbi:M16 family metallopeptidase [Lysobacter silvisoli]|uniref:Insulinase family protein n=1 Tax=Lysobacter silvisoli TaxID=2293254 RepID=A0A371JYL6_9GAMM|nr:pitrilysin family protein [Lysobacter silvisoli]RDZ26768.1 insulinase family protein [Lysobacter silvisoli]